MKYTIRTVQKYHLAYALLPYKRNQDIIKIHELGGSNYCAAVVDGWNSQDEFVDDRPGREVASIVANKYPTLFLKHKWKATEKMDARIAKVYLYLATCVAVFFFRFSGKETIVSVGDAETYLWDGNTWYKPKEISDHWLDVTVYKSNVARFFGSSKHKADPRFPGIFSAEPDTLEINSETPVMFATDGIKDVLKIGDINALPVNPTKHAAKAIVETILHEVSRRGTQRDDISILVRT